MNHLGTLLLVVALFAYQAGLYICFGDLIARRLYGRSAARAGLPEFSFLIGFAAYSLFGYALLILTGSPEVIPPSVVALCLGLALTLRRSPPQAAEPFEMFQPYLALRRGYHGWIAIGMVLLLCAAIGWCRFPWLVQWNMGNAGIVMGTHISDDMRMIGFPLSLAANGYPLRSPYAVDTVLPYPAGAFIFTSGHIALMPSIALPLLIVDSVIGVLFYGLVLLMWVAAVAGGRLVSILIAASGAISVSFNLWRLNPDVKAPWFDSLYGYYRWNGFYTTIAWTPIMGLAWNQNHTIGFASAALAALVFTQALRLGDRIPRASLAVSLIFAAHTAAASMDMSALAVVTGGAMLFLAIGSTVRSGGWKSIPPWVLQGIGVCIVMFGILVALNFPTIVKRTDSPFNTPFPPLTRPYYNLGMMLSTVGPYFVLIAIAAAMLRSKLFRAARFYFVPVAVVLAFSSLFEYHSIWFWRGSFAMHLMLALICGIAAVQLSENKLKFRVFTSIWLLFLLPGVSQAAYDVGIWFQAARKVPPLTAEAIRWIYRNTKLSDRVVAFNNSESSLAPNVDLLRTGNRAGTVVFDRIHAMISYHRYLDTMRNIRAGVAANDFILYHRDSPGFAAILDGCAAPVVFENPATRIYRVDSTCRIRLSECTEETAIEEAPNSEFIANLRRRAEALWEKRQFTEAISYLEPLVARYPKVAEAHYSLAYSYQLSGLNPAAAIEHYQRALALGYTEFWVRYHLGAVYLHLGDKAKARAELERARTLDPKHAGVQELLKQL